MIRQVFECMDKCRRLGGRGHAAGRDHVQRDLRANGAGQLGVARTAFLEARAGGAHVRPNAVTYRLLFKAVGQLLPAGHERTRHTKQLFRLCVEDGCRAEMAYRRLLGDAGPELLRTLTDGWGYAQLPPEWKARVGESAASKPPRMKYGGGVGRTAIVRHAKA